MNNIEENNNNNSNEINSNINEESHAIVEESNGNENLNYDSQESNLENNDEEFSGDDSILELSENFSESEKYNSKNYYILNKKIIEKVNRMKNPIMKAKKVNL
jgi:hypothetical protein